MFKNIFIFSLLGFLMQSCQLVDIVIAQSSEELTFQINKNWDYAANVTPPGMIQQVLRENIDSEWIGDPKRFQVIKINQLGQQSPFYFISPTIECPSDKKCNSEEIRRLHFPACGATGGCSYFAYIEENGKHRKVFEQLIWRQGDEDFFKVSNQLKNGVPACFELSGFDYETKAKGLPPYQENQRFVSRYCYNGKNYVLNRLYLVPIPKKEQ